MAADAYNYRGAFRWFDLSRIRTYPLSARHNRVELGNQADCAALRAAPARCAGEPWFRNGQRGDGADQSAGLRELAASIIQCAQRRLPVIVISGAHVIKNGEIAIVSDLIRRGIVSLYATNVAGVIHSFELALTGASSENVGDGLPKGEFGMAFETGHYINNALALGYEGGLGFGESICRLLGDARFRRQVIERTFLSFPDTGEYLKPADGFPYAEACVFSACFEKHIPACVHATVGTDIIDQHASSDTGIKGALSGADFLILASEVCRCAEGGVVLNIGSAVTGPEVLLKAVSMAANVGKPPRGIVTADFDVRPFGFAASANDETRFYYYLRDQKSVAIRIPQAFSGVGYYFQGLHRQTLPPLYQFIAELGRGVFF